MRPDQSVREAVHLEVARRAEKGSFAYPVVAALTVSLTPMWSEHTVAAFGFVLLLFTLALVRRYVAGIVQRTRSQAAHIALRTLLGAQSLGWGLLVATSWAWFGLSTSTWLCLVVTAGFAAGGTSSLGVHPPTHRVFLTALATPMIITPIVLLHEVWVPLLVCTAIYYAFLLRDGRQNAEAFASLLRTQQELRIARDRARAGDQAKSAFLAMMNHEIRTPMHAVVGTVSLLRGTSLDAKQTRHVNNLVHAGESLLAIINDILDFSRIDAHGIELDIEDFELRSTLEEVLYMLEPLAQKKDLSLDAHFEPSSDAWMRGDRRRLQQVFTNLLGNAIKFTERGRVRLEVETTGRGAELLLSARVQDTGIGIAEEDLERIFDPFEQGEAGSARTHAGSGLGLAICARLVRAMGGSISVRSSKGEGTTFEVELALPRAEPQKRKTSIAPKAAAANGAQGRPLRGKRALVVDDNPMNRELALEMLEQMGCLVETADSGHSALAKFAARPFDVVLMDCQMREMDGYETTVRLRQLSSQAAEVPVLAVTANAFEEDRTRALACGMVDLLAKPFSYQDLLLKLMLHLGEPLSADDAAEDTSRELDLLEGRELYREAALHVAKTLRVEPDAVRVDRVIGAFLTQCPQRTAELERALASGDVQAARDTLHALAGSAPFLGIATLNSVLQQMQQRAQRGDLESVQNELPRLVGLLEDLARGRPRIEQERPALRAVQES